MRQSMVLLVLVIALGQWGCEFIGRSAPGSGATAAGYDYYSTRRMNQLEEDYRAERIGRRDYEMRKGQLEMGYIVY